MDESLDFEISTKSVFKYALPTILSGVFMNIYSMLDSLFVARFIDTTALSAVNIVGPFLAIALALGTMIGVGGSSLVSKQLGEGKHTEAKQNFSFLILVCTVISLLFCAVGIIFRNPILYWMGADEALYPLCVEYAVPLFITIPFAMIGILLQMFYVAAGKPGLGFVLSLAGGGVNIILDILLLKVFPIGVAGAAIGTCVGYLIQSVIGVAYFFIARKGLLCFVKPKWNTKALVKSCSNGFSEMVGMLAVSITMIAMNVILMNIKGADGVAAATIVLSAQTLLSAIYMSYLEGTSALISYNYGKGDVDNLKKLYKINWKLILILSVVTFAAVLPLAKPLALLYADGVENVITMAVQGILVFSPAFLFMGINLFASSMYTAFNDGKTSAILAFFRTLVFLIIPLLILPPFMNEWGVWIAMPIAELLAIFMSLYYFKKGKAKYHYA